MEGFWDENQVLLPRSVPDDKFVHSHRNLSTVNTLTTPKRTKRHSSSLNLLTVEPQQNQGNYNKDSRPKKAATWISHDTLILSETQHSSFLAHMQAHFTSSGKRSERHTLFDLSCIERVFFLRQRGREPRSKHAGPWGKSALCYQGVDCMSDHGHRQEHVGPTSLGRPPVQGFVPLPVETHP